MMPFDPRGAEGRRKKGIFWHHIHISSAAAAAAAIDWAAHAHAERVVSRGEERRARVEFSQCLRR